MSNDTAAVIRAAVHGPVFPVGRDAVAAFEVRNGLRSTGPGAHPDDIAAGLDALSGRIRRGQDGLDRRLAETKSGVDSLETRIRPRLAAVYVSRGETPPADL